jgi:hypothetical protein
MMGSNTRGKLSMKEFADNIEEICHEVRQGCKEDGTLREP